MVKTEPNPYIGQIVIAEVSDIVKNETYKMKAKIKTGNFAGRESFVAYRGNPSFTNQRILVRVDFPFEPRFSLELEDFLKFEENYYATFFISSKIPKGFESGSSADFILYGIWQDRMKGEFDVPILGSIANYYDPGNMVKTLHYSIAKGWLIISYGLTRTDPPIKMRKNYDSGPLRSPGNALRRYIRTVRELFGNFPQVVTTDEHIDFEKIILPEFNDKKITDMGIVRHIEMEPQQ